MLTRIAWCLIEIRPIVVSTLHPLRSCRQRVPAGTVCALPCRTSSQLLCFVILLLSTVTRDLPSPDGLTSVPRTISVAVSVLPYRRLVASLSDSHVCASLATPTNSPLSLPHCTNSA